MHGNLELKLVGGVLAAMLGLASTLPAAAQKIGRAHV